MPFVNYKLPTAALNKRQKEGLPRDGLTTGRTVRSG